MLCEWCPFSKIELSFRKIVLRSEKKLKRFADNGLRGMLLVKCSFRSFGYAGLGKQGLSNQLYISIERAINNSKTKRERDTSTTNVIAVNNVHTPMIGIRKNKMVFIYIV